MNKKRPSLIACAVMGLTLFLCAGSFAEDRSITILNFANETGDETGATMAATTQGIVTSGIKYIGTFKIIPTPSFKIGTDGASLKEYADLTNSEYVIFGKLTAGKGGTVKIENDLYCHADDSVFKAGETVENALDIFSSSDAISVKILSELYKTKIAYGTLTLKLTGPRDKFDVYVNDVLAGSNTTSISSIPDGEKQVRVIARSGRNDGKVLFNDKVVIKPNASTPVAVTFEDLAARVSGKTDKGLLTITSDPPGLLVIVDDGDPVETPVTIEVTPGTHKFEPRASLADARYYEGQPIQWVTVPAGAEAVIPLKPNRLMGKIDYSIIPQDCTILLDDKEIERNENSELDCEAGFYNLEVRRNNEILLYQRAVVAPDSVYSVPWGHTKQGAFLIEEHDIAFKSNSKSWDTIQAAYKTEYPALFGLNDASCIMTVKFARDKKYLYWHVDFNEVNPLETVPSDAGGRTILQFSVHQAKNQAALQLCLVSGAEHYSGFWDDNTKVWEDVGALLDRVSTKKSVTGRMALSTVRKYLDSPYDVYMDIAAKDWKYYSSRHVGWVDFSFLAKK